MFDAVHGRNQSVFDAQRKVGGFEKAFEKQDGLPVTGVAQGHRRLHVEQGKTVGDAVQRLGGAQQPVSVGVGLDHRPGGSRFLSGDVLFGDQVVMAQSSKRD